MFELSIVLCLLSPINNCKHRTMDITLPNHLFRYIYTCSNKCINNNNSYDYYINELF